MQSMHEYPLPLPGFVVKWASARQTNSCSGRARLALDTSVDDDELGLENIALSDSILTEDGSVNNDRGFFAPRHTFESIRYTGRASFELSGSAEFGTISRASFHAMQSTEKGPETVKRFFDSFGNASSTERNDRDIVDELVSEGYDLDACLGEESDSSDALQTPVAEPLPMLLGRRDSGPSGAKVETSWTDAGSSTVSRAEESKEGCGEVLMPSTASVVVATTGSLLRARSLPSASDVAAMVPLSAEITAEEVVESDALAFASSMELAGKIDAESYTDSCMLEDSREDWACDAAAISSSIACSAEDVTLQPMPPPSPPTRKIKSRPGRRISQAPLGPRTFQMQGATKTGDSADQVDQESRVPADKLPPSSCSLDMLIEPLTDFNNGCPAGQDKALEAAAIWDNPQDPSFVHLDHELGALP